MGIFDGIVGAVLGPLVGGIFGGSSAKDTNQSNQQIARQETEFNQSSAREANALTELLAGRATASTEGMASRAIKATEGMTSSALALSKSQFDQSQAFNERMSNSAYTRGIADLKAAGLNPILAATRGVTSTPSVSGGPTASGAGTGGSGTGGSGSSTRASTFRKTDIGLAALNSAASVGRATQEIEAMRLANEARRKFGFGILANQAETVAKTSTSIKKRAKSHFLAPAGKAAKRVIAVTKGRYLKEKKAVSKATRRNAASRTPRSNWGLWDPKSPYNRRNK